MSSALLPKVITMLPSNLFKRILCFLFRCDVLLFLCSIIFFLIYPDFDLTASRFVFDRNTITFVWENTFIPKAIYSLTHVVGVILIISLPILVGISCGPKKTWLAKYKRECLYLLVVLILGPGLMVNSLIKEIWGRPRPAQVIEFGGDKSYISPFHPNFARKDGHGHSFVSGHASMGFYFFCFALLSRKKRWLLVPILLGSVIGAARIIQGGHFSSDIIFSGWVVWFCSIFPYNRFFEKKHPEMNLLALDSFMTLSSCFWVLRKK